MKLGDYSIYRCVECSIEFNTHFPPKETVEETFTGDYYMDVQKSAFDPQPGSHTNDPGYDAFVTGLQQLEQGLKSEIPDDGSKKVLDIGSALGTFLKIAKDRGWEVNGVELSEYGHVVEELLHSEQPIMKDVSCSEDEVDANGWHATLGQYLGAQTIQIRCGRARRPNYATPRGPRALQQPDRGQGCAQVPRGLSGFHPHGTRLAHPTSISVRSA